MVLFHVADLRKARLSRSSLLIIFLLYSGIAVVQHHYYHHYHCHYTAQAFLFVENNKNHRLPIASNRRSLPSSSSTTTTTTTTTRRLLTELKASTATSNNNNNNSNNNNDNTTSNYKYYRTMLSVNEKTRDGLKNKTILLTGATGGLGKALAIQIAHHCDPKCLILSGRKIDTLNNIANECRNSSSSSSSSSATTNNNVIHTLPADLSNKESVQQLGDRALELVADNANRIDVLINCGGVSSRSDFVDTKLDVDEQVMQINFFAGAALAKKVVPGMMMMSGNGGDGGGSSGGKIIWISSVQGLMGIPSRTSYAASKFAVQGYCEALRSELVSSHIQVHCVSPGYIRTNLSLSAVTGDGTPHGTMDAATANGADPMEVAVEILDTIYINGRNDFIVASSLSTKVAIWLRLLCPGVLQSLLVKRYEKAVAAKLQQKEFTDPHATAKKID